MDRLLQLGPLHALIGVLAVGFIVAAVALVVVGVRTIRSTAPAGHPAEHAVDGASLLLAAALLLAAGARALQFLLFP